MPIAPGTHFGPYEVTALLGAGGMGEVYKARDTRLDRPVALKFLSFSLRTDEATQVRFLREARALAALDHPHICTIFDLGTAPDGALFIVMACYEGESLKARIARGPVPVDQALAIAIQLAQGLAAAHRQGIVHRDLKPGNVILTSEGVAKILDFGLATIAGQDRHTTTGVVRGTVAYMSPEQVRGEAIDARADIWALGVVLYEMLTACSPFRAESDLAILNAILHEPATPISHRRRDVPTSLAQAISKALEKDVARRYQTADELLQGLRASSGTRQPADAEKAIIVLPFENMSSDLQQEYFCDGMTEELITTLSQVRSLRVISRSSAMTFKGTRKKVREIADDLNVQYVLEGSVRKAGNQLRITAQLIDAATDAHVWADRYSGTLDDVFDIQEKVARVIVDALKLKLSPEEHRRIAERPIDNVQAYECYLRAREEVYRFTEESFERALRLLRHGLEIQGENVLFYALMGNIYVQYVNSIIKPRAEYLERADECASKILAADPASPLGHWLRGALCHKRGDIQQGVRHLKQALEGDPGNRDALYWLAYAYRVSGKGFAARPLVHRLVSIDPLTPYSHWAAGWIDFFDGHGDEALTSFRHMYELDTNIPLTRWGYGFALAAHARYGEGFQMLDRLLADTPQTFWGRHAVFLKFAFQKRKADALRALTEQLVGEARIDEHVSWMTAAACAFMGESAAALEWLGTAVRRGFINYPYLSQHDTLMRDLRDDQGFRVLMDEIRKRWEVFEV